MRAKRETTYGMPARIPANADRVCTRQDAHDHDAAHHTTGQHDRPPTPERPLTQAPDGSDYLPNAPSAWICRGSTMPSGDGSRLTGNRVAPRQSLAVLP